MQLLNLEQKNSDLVRQCAKCRKQIPARDFDRHAETCQRLVVHTSQNAQAPKVIDFTAKDLGQKAQRSALAQPAKARVSSARPEMKKASEQQDEERPIKNQSVPKWKLESEQIRRASGRS